MFFQDGSQSGGCLPDGQINGDWFRPLPLSRTNVSLVSPTVDSNRLTAGTPLCAEPAEVRRMALVARDLDDSVLFDIYDDPATDATIRANAFDLRHEYSFLVVKQ